MKTKMFLMVVGIFLVATLVSAGVIYSMTEVTLIPTDKSILKNEVTKNMQTKGETIPKDLNLTLHVGNCFKTSPDTCTFRVWVDNAFQKTGNIIFLTDTSTGLPKTEAEIIAEANKRGEEILNEYIDSLTETKTVEVIPTKKEFIIK